MWCYRLPRSSAPDGDAGFSLIETVIGLAIIGTVMAAMVPYLVGSLTVVGMQRGKQTAIQVAADAVERARALKGSSLLIGRGKTSAQTQWAAAPAIAQGALNLTTLDWDPLADPDDGDQAPLPTAAQTVKVDGIAYTRSWYVGRCWQPTTKHSDFSQADPALNATCIGSSAPASTDVPFFRVVVVVFWSHTSCPAQQCSYATSTLISAGYDPLFPVKRPPPTVTDPGPLTSYRTEAVDWQLSALGGELPLVWTASSLPLGLSISTSGRVTGTPTTNSVRTVTATVVAQDGLTDSQTFTWTIVNPMVVTNPGTQTSRVGTAVASVSVVASGGVAPYTWAATNLPAGLAINTSTGVISGTPTAVESPTVSVDVTDANDKTKSVSFTWGVLTPVVVTNPGAQTTTMNAAVNLAMAATGGAAPYTWRATDLPYGLTINASTGAISGTVTRGTRYLTTVYAADSAGMESSTTFVVTVAASAGTDLRVTVPVPATANQVSTAGVATSISPAAAGGAVGIYTWTATGLPPGLTMSTTLLGVTTVSGTPTTKGVYTVKFTVKDVALITAYEMFTWTVQ